MVNFTDNFNRADSASLGPDWISYSPDGVGIVANTAYPLSANICASFTAPGRLKSNDHFAQARLTSVGYFGVSARCGFAATNGDVGSAGHYLWRYDGAGSLQLLRKAGIGNAGYTALGSPVAQVVVVGDLLRIEVEGNSIRGYLNGVLRQTLIDNSVSGGAQAGIRFWNSTTIRADDFSCGDLPSGKWTEVLDANQRSSESSQVATAVNSCTVTWDTTWANEGTHSILVTSTTASAAAWTYINGNPAVRYGAVVRWSCFVRNPQGVTLIAQVGPDFKSLPGGTYITGQRPQLSIPPGATVVVSGKGVVPPGAGSITFVFGLGGVSAIGQALQFDSFSFEQLSRPRPIYTVLRAGGVRNPAEVSKAWEGSLVPADPYELT
jgi:hypothetical protein